MKTINHRKEYKTPEFKFIRDDESNKVFFVASGPTPGPLPKTVGAILSNIGSW